MGIIISKVDKLSFDSNDAELIFDAGSSSGTFALAEYEGKSFKIAWQSDLIDPIVINLSKNIFCIGVDLNVVIVDYSNFEVLFKLELESFLYDIFIVRDHLYIVSELRVVILGLHGYSISGSYDFPDICSGVAKKEDCIEFNLMDGETIKIPIA